ncbi:MAG TPA: hypothetical protein DIT04_07100 [Dysgonomonas sp.]|nr:hypothetical protein [Dysgonomonas sp.]
MSNLIRRNEWGRFPSFFNCNWENDFFKGSWENDLPALNVKENDKEFKLEISAAGFDKGDFNIQVNKDILTVSAKKEINDEEKDENDKVLRQEFSYSTFSRSFTLPDNIDTEKIEAELKNGVLNVVLPKMEKAPEDSKKQIEIK